MENLENETKRTIWERQSGMCALTGKKFEEFNDSIEADFIFVKPLEEGGNKENDNIVMVWKLQELPQGRLYKYNFPYANFVSYSEEDKIADITGEINIAIDLSSKSEDWRHIRTLIKDLTTTLNAMGLSISKRNELRELLMNALENVNQRQTEEIEKNKEVWQANYEELRAKTVEAVDFSKTAEIFKEAREKLIAVQTELKNKKLSREFRSELEKMLDGAFDNLNQRQAEYRENFEMECIENYYKLKLIVDNAIKNAEAAPDFVTAKNTLIEAQKQIKDKVLKRSQKNELFSAIRTVFDSLREKFNEVALSPEEIEANYQKVKAIVDEAVEFAKNATQKEAMDARQKLIETQKIIKEHQLRYTHNNELFAKIREVFERINEMIAEEREQFEAEALSNYSKMSAKIDVIIVEIENAIDFRQSIENLTTFKTELQLLKLKREQRDKLFDRMRVAFDILSKMRERYNKLKFEERMQRLDSRISNLEQKNVRLESLLKKDREILAEQTEKLNNADNDKDKESVTQIVNIVNARISEREDSLKVTAKRIEDVQAEREKIVKRENERKKSNKKSNDKKEQTETSNDNEVKAESNEEVKEEKADEANSEA